jgi:hypothetical protein
VSRSNVLLFLHVLVGMALVGSLFATAVASLASQRLVGNRAAVMRSVGWWSALITAASAVAVLALGEGLAADEDAEDQAWLDVSRALAIFGLLVGGVVLAILARLALSRPRLAGVVGWLGVALALIGLAVAFLMAAKPGRGRQNPSAPVSSVPALPRQSSRATAPPNKSLTERKVFSHPGGIPSSRHE